MFDKKNRQGTLDLHWETLKTESLVTETSVQETFQNEINLPKPIEKAIIPHRGKIKQLNFEVQEEAVIVEGVIHNVILYMDDHGEIHEETFEDNFLRTLSIPEVTSEQHVDVKSAVISVRMLPGEGENVYTLLTEAAFYVKATRSIKMDIVNSVDGSDITPEWGTIQVDDMVTEKMIETEIKKRLLLQMPAESIVRVMADFEDVATKIEQDRVVVSGHLVKQIYYLSQEGGLINEITRTPFKETIELIGARPEMVADVFPLVTDTEYHMTNDRETEVITACKLICRLTTIKDMEVVTDIPNTKTETEELNIKPIVMATRDRQVLSETLNLTDPMNRLLSISSTVPELEKEIRPGSLYLTGKLKVNLTIETEDGNISEVTDDVPFSKTIRMKDISPGQEAIVYSRPGLIEYQVDPDRPHEISITAGVELLVKVIEDVRLEVVVDVPSRDRKSQGRPTLMVYVVQRGDSLYDIAHRFGVGVEDIMAANTIKDSELIFPGQKLVIPYK